MTQGLSLLKEHYIEDTAAGSRRRASPPWSTTIAATAPPAATPVTRPLSQNKVTAIRGLAEYICDDRLDVAGFPGLSDEQLLGRLVAVPGIGPWSVQVFMMRCLHRPDVFPASDLGVRAALMRLDERPVVPASREAARRVELGLTTHTEAVTLPGRDNP